MKPSLVIMAAGMGSRFGGSKQSTAVDNEGHFIIDYSIYDAWKAGFEDVVCIIAPDMEEVFKKHFTEANKHINIRFAYQKMDNLPKGYSIPEGRVKPWGTAHAVMSITGLVNAPFAVLNADDYYGKGAYKLLYEFLTSNSDNTNHAMIGYLIENTLSESGFVSRGVCKTQDNKLSEIQEILKIRPADGGAEYTLNDTDFTFLPNGTIVSMNIFGFKQGLLQELEQRFVSFLENNLKDNPLKCEYLLPVVVGELVKEHIIKVNIIPTDDKWYGVTYIEDLQGVKDAICDMKKQGIIPEILWR